jgi:hypothetical protein
MFPKILSIAPSFYPFEGGALMAVSAEGVPKPQENAQVLEPPLT